MCRENRGLVLRFAIHSDEDNGSKHEEKPHKYGHHRTAFYVVDTEQILCPWMLQFQSVFISFSVLFVFSFFSLSSIDITNKQEMNSNNNKLSAEREKKNRMAALMLVLWQRLLVAASPALVVWQAASLSQFDFVYVTYVCISRCLRLFWIYSIQWTTRGKNVFSPFWRASWLQLRTFFGIDVNMEVKLDYIKKSFKWSDLQQLFGFWFLSVLTPHSIVAFGFVLWISLWNLIHGISWYIFD